MAKASSSHWDLAGHLRALGEAAALRPLGLVCFSSLSFTTQSLFVKLLGQSGLGSFQAIMVRGLFQMTGASCILLSWGTPVNSWLGNDRQQAGLLFLRALFGYGGIAFGFMAINLTSLANSQVASQMTPVWSALLGRICLGEKWEWVEMLATLMSAIGVCLVFQPAFLFDAITGSSSSDDDVDGTAAALVYGDDNAVFDDLHGTKGELKSKGGYRMLLAFNSTFSGASSDTADDDSDGLNDTLGIVLALLGSVCAASAYLLIRLSGTSNGVPMQFPKLMFAQALGQFTLAGPSLWVSNQEWVNPNGHQVAMLFGCGFLGFTGQVCMTMGMQRAKTASASVMRQTGIVFAFIYDAFLVPGEVVSLATVFGATVICASTGGLAYVKAQAATPPSLSTEAATELTSRSALPANSPTAHNPLVSGSRRGGGGGDDIHDDDEDEAVALKEEDTSSSNSSRSASSEAANTLRIEARAAKGRGDAETAAALFEMASDMDSAEAAEADAGLLENAPLAARPKKGGPFSEGSSANGASSSSSGSSNKSSGTSRLVAVLTPTRLSRGSSKKNSSRKKRTPYSTVVSGDDDDDSDGQQSNGGGSSSVVSSSGDEDEEGPLPDISNGVDWADIDSYESRSGNRSKNSGIGVSSGEARRASSHSSSHGNSNRASVVLAGTTTAPSSSSSLSSSSSGLAPPPTMAWSLGNGEDPWGDAASYEATHFENGAVGRDVAEAARHVRQVADRAVSALRTRYEQLSGPKANSTSATHAPLSNAMALSPDATQSMASRSNLRRSSGAWDYEIGGGETRGGRELLRCSSDDEADFGV